MRFATSADTYLSELDVPLLAILANLELAPASDPKWTIRIAWSVKSALAVVRSIHAEG